MGASAIRCNCRNCGSPGRFALPKSLFFAWQGSLYAIWRKASGSATPNRRYADIHYLYQKIIDTTFAFVLPFEYCDKTTNRDKSTFMHIVQTKCIFGAGSLSGARVRL